eukprot:760482-Hanusia_phi.AAC.8
MLEPSTVWPIRFADPAPELHPGMSESGGTVHVQVVEVEEREILEVAGGNDDARGYDRELDQRHVGIGRPQDLKSDVSR